MNLTPHQIYTSLTSDQKQKVNHLIAFGDDKELALFEEVHNISETLRAMVQKKEEENSLNNKIVVPEVSDQKEFDMTETNVLLKQILEKDEKEAEPVDISVTLKLV